jgi:hypothetical protein
MFTPKDIIMPGSLSGKAPAFKEKEEGKIGSG